MKVGDLAYPNKMMRDLSYPEVGIIIAIEGGRYRLAFPDGSDQIFHPKWIKNHPINKEERL